MICQALREVLDLAIWEVDLAAWVFTGYSPLKLKRYGKILRLVDDEAIPHGTSDFRDAEKEKNRILKLLLDRVGGSLGIEFTFKKDSDGNLVQDKLMPNESFDRNWLISGLTNKWEDDEKIEPWWIDIAIEDHFLPAYINPDALAPAMIEVRGWNSFFYPSKPEKIINPPDVVPLKSRFVEGEARVHTVASTKAKGETFRTLYKRSSIEPKSRFYKFLCEKIEELITEVPEVQFEGFPPIKGWDKHCRPRPTGQETRELAMSAFHRQEGARVLSTTADGDLCWTELEPDEKGRTSIKTLATRIDQWFERTDAGFQYQNYIREKKKSA
jgi:hypothetical protein